MLDGFVEALVLQLLQQQEELQHQQQQQGPGTNTTPIQPGDQMTSSFSSSSPTDHGQRLMGIKAARTLPKRSGGGVGMGAGGQQLSSPSKNRDVEREYEDIHSTVIEMCAQELQQQQQEHQSSSTRTPSQTRSSATPAQQATQNVMEFAREQVRKALLDDAQRHQKKENRKEEKSIKHQPNNSKVSNSPPRHVDVRRADQNDLRNDDRGSRSSDSDDDDYDGDDDGDHHGFRLREDAFDRCDAKSCIDGNNADPDPDDEERKEGGGYINVLGGGGEGGEEGLWEGAFRDVLQRAVEAASVQLDPPPLTAAEQSQLLAWMCGGSDGGHNDGMMDGDGYRDECSSRSHSSGVVEHQYQHQQQQHADGDGCLVFDSGGEGGGGGEGFQSLMFGDDDAMMDVPDKRKASINDLVRNCLATLGEPEEGNAEQRQQEESSSSTPPEQRKQQQSQQPSWMTPEFNQPEVELLLLQRVVRAVRGGAEVSPRTTTNSAALARLYTELLLVLPTEELLAYADSVDIGGGSSSISHRHTSVPGWKAVVDRFVYCVVVPCVIELLQATVLFDSTNSSTDERDVNQSDATDDTCSRLDGALRVLGRWFHALEATPELLSTIMGHFTHVLQFVALVVHSDDLIRKSNHINDKGGRRRRLQCLEQYHTKLLALYWRMCVSLSPYGGLGVHNHDRKTIQKPKMATTKEDENPHQLQQQQSNKPQQQQHTAEYERLTKPNGSLSNTTHAHCWLFYPRAAADLLTSGVLGVWLLHCRPCPLYQGIHDEKRSDLRERSKGEEEEDQQGTDEVAEAPATSLPLADAVDPLCAWLRLYWLGAHNKYYYYVCSEEEEDDKEEEGKEIVRSKTRSEGGGRPAVPKAPPPTTNGTTFPLVQGALSRVLTTPPMTAPPTLSSLGEAEPTDADQQSACLSDYCSYFPSPLSYFVPAASSSAHSPSAPPFSTQYLLNHFQRLTEASCKYYLDYNSTGSTQQGSNTNRTQMENGLPSATKKANAAQNIIVPAGLHSYAVACYSSNASPNQLGEGEGTLSSSLGSACSGGRHFDALQQALRLFIR